MFWYTTSSVFDAFPRWISRRSFAVANLISLEQSVLLLIHTLNSVYIGTIVANSDENFLKHLLQTGELVLNLCLVEHYWQTNRYEMTDRGSHKRTALYCTISSFGNKHCRRQVGILQCTTFLSGRKYETVIGWTVSLRYPPAM